MLNKIYRSICQIEVALASVLLCGSVIVIFVSAMMRTANHPINWAMDIALLMFTWATFMGADVAYRNGSTVFVDFVVNRVPEKTRKIMRLISYILVFVFLCMLVYNGVILCVKSWARTFQGIPGFSYTWVTLSIPVCCTLMIITNLRKIYYEYIKHTEVPILENPGLTPWKGGDSQQ